MITDLEKRRLRRRMESLRAALSPEERRRKSLQICNLMKEAVLERLEQEKEGLFTVFTYLPFRTEVDVQPLIEWCWQRQIRVVVPKADREHHRMDLYLFHPGDILRPGAWGIPEPLGLEPSRVCPSEVNLMVVPGLAFDEKGGRLGYGGGYYDRFVRQYSERGWKEPYKIAPAFSVQIIDTVPVEAHDFFVDQIVTENGRFILRPCP